MAVPVAVLVLLCGVIAVLLLIIWSIKRHPDPHLHLECDLPIGELMASVAGLTHGVPIDGNSVEVLQNEKFFDVVLRDIAEAQETVHFESFLWKEGEIGQRFADALSERARAGLKVRVLLDAAGSKKMGKAAEKQLKEAGCRLVKFHARTPRNIGVVNHRDHRKLVILDGRIAYVGGHCIVDDWLRPDEHGRQARDISVKLRGPIVHAVQSAFSENWVEETGDLFVGDTVFPPLEPAGNVQAHVAHLKPVGASAAVKILHHMIIPLAQKRIWIQNPYFLPEPEAIDAFGKAVARGVDVRVVVPSADASDMPLVQHAAHRNFEKLLACGVRLFEFPHGLLHQKVVIVDSIWCAVGSTNFDDRAFEINDEITLGFKSPELARELEAIFERDQAQSEEIQLEQWRHRGAFHKLKDQFFYLFNEQL